MLRYLKAVAVALALFTINCGSQDIVQKNDRTCNFQSVQNLNEGLTVYKASGDELCGSFRSENNAVHFQTIRGEDLVFGVNTADPDAPAYSVSVRILDRDGNPVAIAFGDRDHRTSDWKNKVDLGNSNPDLYSTFTLAQDATEVLSQMGISGFDEEIKTLKRRSFTAAPDVNTSNQQLSKAQALLTTWRYWIRIFRKDAWFNGFFADHSAVIVNETSPGGSIVNYVTCNHGTCADDASMHFLCQKLVYPATRHSITDDMCSSVASYGFLPKQYVCNDSTLLEYNVIVYGDNSTTTCTDSSLRLWSPTCY